MWGRIRSWPCPDPLRSPRLFGRLTQKQKDVEVGITRKVVGIGIMVPDSIIWRHHIQFTKED